MRAVRFDEYGGVDVLEVREVEDPVAGRARCWWRSRPPESTPARSRSVKAGSTTAGRRRFPRARAPTSPASFSALGEGVSGFAVGDEVLGWTEQRASQAELVVAPADQLTAKPASVPWEVAGSLFVVGMAALASVEAVEPQAGETVVVSAAAGGVGSVAVQLARNTGATVIGLAGERNHDWLRSHDIIPVTYGDGQARAHPRGGRRQGRRVHRHLRRRLCRAGDRARRLPDRINTIIDYETAQRVGAHAEGTHAIASAPRLPSSPSWSPTGASRYRSRTPIRSSRFATAFTELADRHTHGKIVLLP